MATQPLPLSNIVTVNVSVAAASVAAKTFNVGLIVGSSTVIPSYGANARIQQFASTAAMLTAGFSDTSPEYLAAEGYFGADSAPGAVMIGRQDLTAIQTAIPHSGAAGTNYKVGDVVGVTQVGASNGLLTVSAIGANGAVTTLTTTVSQQGTGYSVATGLTTTGGSGTGLEVDITAVGESLLQGVEACSLASQSWYFFSVCGAVDADHLALAQWSNANWQTSFYIGASSDSAIAAGTTNNLALQLQALKYKAALVYSTTQSGLYPDNAYAAAAVMGQAAGLATGLAGSYFQMANQTIAGVAPEPINQTQYSTITGANCNVVANFGAFQNILRMGICSSGDYIDQILFRAMYANLLQINFANQLTSQTVPMNNPGQATLLHTADLTSATMASVGYLGPGVWQGSTITLASGKVGIQNGQTLASGYLNFSDTYASQTQSARQARQAMPIYSCINEANAVASITIQVNVNS